MEQATPLDEKSFWEKYYFENSTHVMVVNPLTTDYSFQMVVQLGIDRNTGRQHEEARKFAIKAGGKERWVGSVANLYLDQMAKKQAQDADRFGDIGDWNARARYYDDLIVDIADPYATGSYIPYDPTSINAPSVNTPVAEVPFAQVAAEDEEKKRLERENEELKAKLAEISKPETSVLTGGLVTPHFDEEGSAEEQPFAGVVAGPPKHAGGRPPKNRG